MAFNQLCAVCREPFIAKRRSARFCKASHRKAYNRNPNAYRRKVTLKADSVTGLHVVPLKLREANDLVAQMHRHHKKVVGHRFSLGATLNGVLVGAVIVSRPVSRHYNEREVAEVTRLVTDGTKNVASKLYAQAAAACKAMGFSSIQTYILDYEPGTSLKAAGWALADRVEAKDINWGARSKRGAGKVAPTAKQRWVKHLAGRAA
jgi:hypothetical protein